MKLSYTITRGANDNAFDIRTKVFVEECGFAPEIETDRFDTVAWHIVLYADGVPVATGRVFAEPDRHHLGRICVLNKYRGLGLSEILLGLLLKKCKEEEAYQCFLSSRTYITPLYRKFGFIERGEEYLEDGKPHIEMYVKTTDIKYTDKFLSFMASGDDT